MKVAVISRWYEEEFFAPFFLNHYSPRVDEVYILLEESSKDSSEYIARRYSNARVIKCNTGGYLNDRILSDMMSDFASSLKVDWVVRADADEYIFPYGMKDFRQELSKVEGNVVNVLFRWIYRHEADEDLDPNKDTVYQRRHGGGLHYLAWHG